MRDEIWSNLASDFRIHLIWSQVSDLTITQFGRVANEKDVTYRENRPYNPENDRVVLSFGYSTPLNHKSSCTNFPLNKCTTIRTKIRTNHYTG